MRGAAARRPARFRRPQRRLRAGLVQLFFAVAGLGLGLLLPRVTVAPTVASSRVTETLIGVGFGVLGLVSIIFSLLFLVVQWAFSSLSPRLNLFRDDPIVWRTFGLAVGVFVFSVTAALVIGNDPEVSVIVPAAEVAGVLAAIALIRALQVKAFASIQLAPTLSAILQQLDVHGLSGAAGSAVIVLRARIGDTLQDGAVVAALHGGDASDAEILAGLVTGQERTFGQDPLFAFRLLADIGLRALSPAVNDPATAVQVLDTVESLLAPLVTRDLDVAEISDDAGTVKVVLALPSWDDYLRIALDDLIEAGSRSPMVLLRTRALLTGLLDAAPPPCRSSIAWRLHRAEELASGNFPQIWRHAAGGDPA
jgi:uncharacterized membrane protein